MGNIQKSWAEVQYRLRNALGTAHGKSGTAAELLKYTETNRRINNVPQAQWGAFLEQEFDTFISNSTESHEDAIKIWGFVIDAKTTLEKYQFTLADKEDARNEFLEAKMYEAKAAISKGRNTLSIESASSGDSSAD